MRRLLVTAGSTATHIDKVRVVTNIFRGTTGEQIANWAEQSGWQVTLLTSRFDPHGQDDLGKPTLNRIRFKTFDDLADLMEREVRRGNYDAIVHSAAVSDYRPDGVFYLDSAGSLRVVMPLTGSAADKIPSSCDELYVRLVPTFKIVDFIRSPWGFGGKLVKFKLQVGMPDQELIDIAKRSIVQSDADFIVANCREWARERAYVISRDGAVQSVRRDDLAYEVLRRLA